MRPLCGIAIWLLAWNALAATPPPKFGCPAALAEYHQFDFWIGRWEVRDPSGKVVVGHSLIESVADGCGVSEHWTGTKGSNGVSYNAWDAQSKRWHQFWIGNNPNGVLRLEGAIQHGDMALIGRKSNAQTGKSQLQRITWTPKADGSVRQHWETSDNDGKTWADAFDGIYRKEPN
ncbi:MAG: hypothetical protein E6K53_09345 [Gammaproteobacteria bacterium]|nr:MAG: hypothetical protein E6K53_09345 [Gammaproteobacteria bacterium]